MCKYYLIVIFSFLLLGTNAQTPNFNEFIGVEYRSLTELDYFSNYSEMGGSMIESLDSEKFALEHYALDSIHLIVLVIVKVNELGKAQYTFLDAVKIILQNNEYIQYGLCRLDEGYNSDLIASYKSSSQKEEFYSDIIFAWTADRQSKRIVSIETVGIDCINEGYGLFNDE
ncbi:MAG: hypothetical protein HRT58_06665 [Crocinitomicaceae bacterium]|nr:hypothetical protein [Flavobacteriales bacterium]NQZ35328.1 hypothetical protein [Crocinitomicaceae bacterium]